jgi:hypothetical protein
MSNAPACSLPTKTCSSQLHPPCEPDGRQHVCGGGRCPAAHGCLRQSAGCEARGLHEQLHPECVCARVTYADYAERSQRTPPARSLRPRRLADGPGQQHQPPNPLLQSPRRRLSRRKARRPSPSRRVLRALLLPSCPRLPRPRSPPPSLCPRLHRAYPKLHPLQTSRAHPRSRHLPPQNLFQRQHLRT